MFVQSFYGIVLINNACTDLKKDRLKGFFRKWALKFYVCKIFNYRFHCVRNHVQAYWFSQECNSA